MRVAAGLDANRSVEINAGDLSLILDPEEREQYLTLLTDLVEKNRVTSFSADRADTQIDGVARVQITAPDGDYAAIKDRIRASGLHVADVPVRFLVSGS